MGQGCEWRGGYLEGRGFRRVWRKARWDVEFVFSIGSRLVLGDCHV